MGTTFAKGALWGMVSALLAIAGCGFDETGVPDTDAMAVACYADSQCDDQNDCTLDQCISGECRHLPDIEGEPCDDRLACTQNTRCVEGACLGDPLDCAALGDICNTGVCDEAAGGCVLDPVDDGTPCEDGLYCTTGDACTAGTCGGAPRDCAGAGDACNGGICDEPSASCVPASVPDGTACDDGLACTTGDVCTGGACGGAGAMDCSSLDGPCTVGVCDEATGGCVAQPANEGGGCDDGLYCTTGDSCAAGVCGGAPRDCSALGGACAAGSCDEATDACVASPANEGDPCEDGLACTINDACVLGSCTGGARDCSAFSNACNLGACTEAAGGCVATPANEGGACDDGLYCSTGDACAGGACLAGASRSCDDGDACTTDSCDEGADGCVQSPVPPIPGAEGPPGNATCTDGIDNDCDGTADGTDANCLGCVGPADCDDGNPCTGDSCSAGTCVNSPVSGPVCNDGLYCTTGDVCTAGTCGGAPRDCSGWDGACIAGQCSETGDACVAVAANEGAACEDGLYCTVGDVCAAGTCAGAPRDCSGASTTCATGSCDETANACGTVPANEGGACSDGLYCTVADACSGGACGGGPRDCSSAANACASGVCNEGTDACAPQPLTDGTACNALFCLNGETCTAGVCGGGTPACTDADACTNEVCNEATATCSFPARAVDPASTVATTSADATPLTACLVAGSGARLLAWVDLRDTAGVPLTGATVTIGGAAATASAAQPGVYWRELTAGAMTGTANLPVVATACGSTVTLASSITLTHVAANGTNGGTGGCTPVDGSLRVKVIAAETGAPVMGASVLVGMAGDPAAYEHAPEELFGGAAAAAANTATTDASGFATFYDYSALLSGPVTVTAGATNRAYFTIVAANASDLVLALPLLHPPAPAMVTYSGGASSGGVTPWLPTGCSDVDAGIALPKLQLDFFSSFQIEGLMGRERCWNSTNGLVGTVAVPENLFIPAQSIGPLCFGGSVAEAPWTLRLRVSPPNENLHMVLASAPWNDVQSALSGGGIQDILKILTYRRIGFDLEETVSGAVTGHTVAMNETYPNNFVVTYSGRPAQTDVIGLTAGDYAGTNGTGSLFLIGSAVHEWDVAGSSVTIPNSDLNAAGNPTMERRLASIAALYLDPADPGRATPPPANRADGVTTILVRGGAMAPFGTMGGTATVTNFLGLAGTTYTAPGTFQWENATANGNSPLYSVHELSLTTGTYLPLLSCQTENEVRDQHSVQWIVVKPFGLDCGTAECFTLPTLPASFPRAAAGTQQRSGFEQRVGSGAACATATDCVVAGEACVDPDGATGAATLMCLAGAGTTASPYTEQTYVWRLHLYDLELAPTFDFQSWQFADRILYLTHESSNEATFD